MFSCKTATRLASGLVVLAIAAVPALVGNDAHAGEVTLSVQEFIVDRATYSTGDVKNVEGIIACSGPTKCLLHAMPRPSGPPTSTASIAHISLIGADLPREDRRRLLDCPSTVVACHVIAGIYVAPDGSNLPLDLQNLKIIALKWLP